jgi:Protein of unknown function (DUF2844)
VLHNTCMIQRTLACTTALFIFSTWWVGSARASLGGDAASVSADADELHGVVLPSTLGQLEIHEIVADNGMRVREFLNRAGIVFAVTWRGPVMPNLQQLLGTRFPIYAAALSVQQRPGLQRSVSVATPELVVEAEGHLRAYVGRSYLPALLPPGVSIGELR